MSNSAHSNPLTLDAVAAREELRRVVASPEFAGSERGRTVLTYLVESALSGGVERLKERTIGVEIFGRDASYDTGQDAIVRVSANSIRKRLLAYYSRLDAAGEPAAVRITLPPGAYAPEFMRTEPAAEPAAKAVTHPLETGPRRSHFAYGVAIAALALACAFLGVQNWRLRAEPARAAAASPIPWSTIAAHSDARIVMTDANFTLHRFFVRREMTLSEYTSQKWLWELREKAPNVLPLSDIQYTSVASARTAARIGSLLERAGCTAYLHSARSLQMSDFKEARPLILLGSAPSNPWVDLFADRLNFVLDVDLERRVQFCRNVSPRAGEEMSYTATVTAQAPGTSYAIITLVPNLSGKGQVLLIAGTGAEATEAAGELAVDLPRMSNELRRRGIDPAGKVRQLELLVRVNSVNRSPNRSEVIAHRVAY
jgi:hypothetical protein